jgi:hypothetical protein
LLQKLKKPVFSKLVSCLYLNPFIIATVNMNSNTLNILYCQSLLFPGSYFALLYDNIQVNGCTGLIQLRLGNSLGSKGMPLVSISLDISSLLIIYKESSSLKGQVR